MATTAMLRQNTAITLTIGPFIDSGNGHSAMTGLTISQADVRLSKNDSSFAQKNQSSSASHKENGYYSCSVDATDTNTLGVLTLAVAEAGALPVRHDYDVVTSNVYDTMFSTGKFSVDVDRITGSAFGAVGLIDSGIAQATSANTITLRSGFSANGAVMVGATVFITDALNGQKDRAIILTYASGTQVATVESWAAIPVGVVSYEVFATPRGSSSLPAPVNVVQMYGSEHAAKRMQLGALAIVSGVAIAGTLSSTQMTTDLLEATNDHYIDRTLIWTSGALVGATAVISDYVGSSKLLTFTTTTTGEAPQAGDGFIIV